MTDQLKKHNLQQAHIGTAAQISSEIISLIPVVEFP